MAAAMRSSNSRTIPDLNLDLVWIAPGAFLMGTPEQNVFAKWYYEVQAKRTGCSSIQRTTPETNAHKLG